jgi:hypothetical protein
MPASLDNPRKIAVLNFMKSQTRYQKLNGGGSSISQVKIVRVQSGGPASRQGRDI